ncbi:serine hydrolase [Desulfosediminicola sp.]|uniref:serine hydrolase n=1 Tax=Desulfosediminicola sp. TaxID=2886825 RepID=UPI003AF2CB49
MLFAAQGVRAEEDTYDIMYIWDSDLERVLDYKEQLQELLDEDISRGLKVVTKDKEYGVIYDANDSPRNVILSIARQGELLRKAGLDEAWAIKEKGYDRLYNVSYGLGPHLDSLKKLYTRVYVILGEQVGKDLFIEKTNSNNYILIYRRQGDRRSTMNVAKSHARMLKSRHIKTSITPENNNPIVYGESSLLDDTSNSSPGEAAEKGDDTQVANAGEGATEKEVPESPIKPEEVEAAVNRIVSELSNKIIASRDQKSGESQPSETIVLESPEKEVQPQPPAKVNKPEKIVAITQTKTKKVYAVSSGTLVESNINQYIKELRRKGQIRGDERTGWMVYDLENDRSLVNINGDQQFQAASMIKPFVALAFFHQVKNGKIQYGPKSRRMLEAMIQRSSNTATNWAIRQVGGPAATERLLRNHYGSIFRNIVITEYIPASGRTYKNSAPPSDYIRFLRALWNVELPYSKEIRRIMALPKRDRLYYGTSIPRGTLVYNKTGSTAHLCGDMGIIVAKTRQGKRYPYAIIGVIEGSSRPANYGNWMLTRGNVIRKVSTIVYQDMKEKHNFM